MQVTDKAARRAQTTHAFVPGRGYFSLGALPLPAHAKPAHMALPRLLADASTHFLTPPHGGEALEFTWVAAEQAWARYGGHRMAFTATYLASVGWTYDRAA